MQLVAQDLTCVRGGRVVFEALSFDLPAGSGMSLEGPNGAGKSTLLRTIAGLLTPAAGRIELTGADDDRPLAERCHFVGHLNGVKRTLTVAENMVFWSRYLGSGGVGTEAALARVGLAALADVPAGLLSAGQGRRLALARLLAAPRPLWLLDEPSVSLDRQGCELLAALIEEHVAAGGLVAAATHVGLGVDFARVLRLGRRSGGP